jgi:hypothetical protein
MYTDKVLEEINESVNKSMDFSTIVLSNEDKALFAKDFMGKFGGNFIASPILKMANNSLHSLEKKSQDDGLYITSTDTEGGVVDAYKVPEANVKEVEDFLAGDRLEKMTGVIRNYQKGGYTFGDRANVIVDGGIDLSAQEAGTFSAVVANFGNVKFERGQELVDKAKKAIPDINVVRRRDRFDEETFKREIGKKNGKILSVIALEAMKNPNSYAMEQFIDNGDAVVTVTDPKGLHLSTHTVSQAETGVEIKHQVVGSNQSFVTPLPAVNGTSMGGDDLAVGNREILKLYSGESSYQKDLSLILGEKLGLSQKSTQVVLKSLNGEDQPGVIFAHSLEGDIVGAIKEGDIEGSLALNREFSEEFIRDIVEESLQVKAQDLKERLLDKAQAIQEDANVANEVTSKVQKSMDGEWNEMLSERVKDAVDSAVGDFDIESVKIRIEEANTTIYQKVRESMDEWMVAGGMAEVPGVGFSQRVESKFSDVYNTEAEAVIEGLNVDFGSEGVVRKLSEVATEQLATWESSIPTLNESADAVNEQISAVSWEKVEEQVEIQEAPEEIEELENNIEGEDLANNIEREELENNIEGEELENNNNNNEVEQYTRIMNDENSQYVVDMLLASGVRFSESGENPATYVAGLDNSPESFSVHTIEGQILVIDSTKEIKLVDGEVSVGDKRDGINYGKFNPEKTLEKQKDAALEEPLVPTPQEAGLTEEELKEKREKEERERAAGMQRPGSGGAATGGGIGNLFNFGAKDKEKKLKVDGILATKSSAEHMEKSIIGKMKEGGKLIDSILKKGMSASPLEVAKLSRTLDSIDFDMNSMKGHKGVTDKGMGKVQESMMSLMEKAEKAGNGILLKGMPLKETAVMKSISSSMEKVIDFVRGLFKGKEQESASAQPR